MSGTALVYELFAECRTGAIDTHNGLCPNALTDVRPVISAIAITMLIKAALTVVTFGIKLPAGIFIPSLVVGACTGRITGITMQTLMWKFPDSSVFAACKGDASCIVPGMLGVCRQARGPLTYFRSLCHGWSSSDVIWCDCELAMLLC